ncbi:DMTF1 [Acanthosepion pharaonis]|uniref:DMTF1 n=1 Tax=Acanthosepion pharaonis TaxID=158019 RepID=A0A812DXT8_ACAPH|nr:DMTF1 [Sepia pharaonis]
MFFSQVRHCSDGFSILVSRHPGSYRSTRTKISAQGKPCSWINDIWMDMAQHSSPNQNSLSLTVTDHAIESNEVDSKCDSNQNGMDGKDDLKVLTGDSGLAPGQHYLIVTRDTAAALGVGTLEDDGTTESGSKRLRLSGDDGQTYVFTVTEPSPNIQGDHKVTEASKLQAATTATSSTQSRSSGRCSNNDTFVTQAWFTTRNDKTALQNKGHSWVQGQWTKDEIELLQANINSYCKDNNINDPTEIIFEMSKDERKDFYRTVAKGLNRPLFSVYRRVIRMYDQKNYVGKYSQDEMIKLRELQSKHGTDWAAIGAVLGRSASSVKDKCRLMKDTCNSGKWLPEEECRLTDAVCELTGAQPGENITHGLSWAAVAERVGTRSEKQCRTKWLNYLNWKQQGGAEWTREDDINLILKMSSSGATDETQLDWNELAKDWPSVRSPQWLRGKWWSLKRHVADYQLLSFTALVDYLKVIHLKNVRLKNPVNNNLRVAKVDLPRTNAISADIPYPTSLPIANSSTISQVDSNDVSSEGALHTYEVLQQLAPTSSSAFLITQPQNNPAISLTGSMTTDHIIVHTLPVSQSSSPGSKVNENVTVQINPQPQVIIGSGDGSDTVISLDNSAIDHSVPLADNISHSDSDIHCLSQSDQDACEIGQSELDAQDQISNQNDLPLNPNNLDSSISHSEMENTSAESDLVMVTSASSHYVQSSTTKQELMSLPVEILTTDGEKVLSSDLTNNVLPEDNSSGL